MAGSTGANWQSGATWSVRGPCTLGRVLTVLAPAAAWEGLADHERLGGFLDSVGMDVGLGRHSERPLAQLMPAEGRMCQLPGPFSGLGQAQHRQNQVPPSHRTQARPVALPPLLPYLVLCPLFKSSSAGQS